MPEYHAGDLRGLFTRTSPLAKTVIVDVLVFVAVDDF